MEQLKKQLSEEKDKVSIDPLDILDESSEDGNLPDASVSSANSEEQKNIEDPKKIVSKI